MPWGPVLVVLACIFVDALQMMLVYPFLPFLVADLLGPGRSADVAAHAGLLAGAYKLGQFVCAPAYGYAADALGRRPTILVSLAAGPVALVLFGTAQSLRAALAWRLAQGLASAAGTVGKASLADLTDSTNEARVFSYTGLSMALGVIVGPVLGGVLARPCHSPLAGDASGTGLCALEPQPGLLRRYAYLAPCAVAAALTLCTLIAACVLLPETRPTVQARPGGAAGRGAAAGGDSNASPLLASAPAAIDGAASKGTAAAPAPELWRAFAVVQATQVSFKLKINGFAEVLPVRMAAAPEQGGSALGARTIGLSQAFGGIVLVGVVLVAFPRCVRAAGLAGTLRAGLAAQVCLFAIPLALDAARAAISRLGGVLAPGGGSLAVGAYAAAWAVRAFALNVVRGLGRPQRPVVAEGAVSGV